MLFGKRIYLDHASSTPVLPAASRATRKASRLGNPGSIHADGVLALRALRNARERIARELACKAREVIFTSGLSESNTLAILGAVRARALAGKDIRGTHWVTTSIEHASVLECFAEIERLGGTVTHIDPDPKGLISAETIARALRPETVFVSVGWANNEIGTLQPLVDITRVIRAHEGGHKATILFHSDAGQGPLYKTPYVHTLGVDLFSLGSGKLYGPRGIGALYVSNRAELAPLVLGGSQERGLRAGTENPALSAGFATAFANITSERAREARRVGKLRDMLARDILGRIPGAVVNGDLAHALPHMLNVSIPGISGEYLVLSLDREGISVATKSACEEGSARSHVVSALGPAGSGEPAGWRAENTVRFSLGRATRARDIRFVIRALSGIVRNSAARTPES